jgi:hypothetical protein
MLDGFDSGLYIFVLVPALIDLLHSGGLEASKGNIAQYDGYLFSIFMLGCGALHRVGRHGSLMAFLLRSHMPATVLICPMNPTSAPPLRTRSPQPYRLRCNSKGGSAFTTRTTRWPGSRPIDLEASGAVGVRVDEEACGAGTHGRGTYATPRR